MKHRATKNSDHPAGAPDGTREARVLPKKRVILFVPGIMQFPYDARNWDGRAATFMNFADEIYLTDRADYFCGPIGRAFFQERRVARVKNTLSQYLLKDFKISLVAHSNGTDLVLRALKELGWPRVEALHLFSGACEANFDKNGLNYGLMSERIGRVFVYVAGKDLALRLAHGWLGKLIGYGTLGLKGPIGVNPESRIQNPESNDALARVQVLREPDFGHSDWFAPANFDQTMNYCRRL